MDSLTYYCPIWCFYLMQKENLNPDETVIKEAFKEGTVEMGMFSGEIDFGKFIDQLDFTKSDVKIQFTSLVNSLPANENPLSLIQQLQTSNPLSALAATLSISKCTYIIKDQTVLGKAKGLGWNMDHLHNEQSDIAKMYLETVITGNQIAEADKKLYTSYIPSKDLGAGSRNELDLDNFIRKKQTKKVNVSGYECDVIIYEQKSQPSNDQDITNPLNKLVVYTSPLFDKTINFTHPYYLPEQGGILRIDIYLEEKNTPTIVMKPVSINPRTVSDNELITRTASPQYEITDMNFGFKSLSIILSGWGVLGE